MEFNPVATGLLVAILAAVAFIFFSQRPPEIVIPGPALPGPVARAI